MPLPIACLFAAKGLFLLVERAQERARATRLVVATILLAVLPVFGLRESFTSRNDDQLARLRHVFESTKPTDLVMDGWEGTGVFRPHAFYYFFIHDELLLEVPPEETHRVAEMVEQEMSGCMPLNVPIKVDVAVGDNWAEVEAWAK